ncbi:TonB-dependent receptor plug domain-containing protein [Steroidobacter sp.]|uniref:TonB-dependent receptor plug domain-containing protein n=1 Tax=Steroidobacter sp. TaxID=1978227 RepID=UPI001A52D960|nr:TonB-dependent receptor plug domain-containing protein [Steroidobacter sp.]MBL8268608.1 TonB-dependent receptor plug domain-containing protein [Steroidobacter sp.]
MLKTMRVRSTIAAILAGLALSANAVADAARVLHVPAGDLVTALEALAKQADIELVYQAEQLKGIHTEGVNGSYEPKEAVFLLLKGTHLGVRTDSETGVMLVSPLKDSPANATSRLDAELELQEIVVTGSRLQVPSEGALPVNVYSRDAIDRSGQPTIATFLANQSEVSTSISDTTFAGGGSNRQSGIQLRGLPAGTTLVLLNGRRVQPGSISTTASVVDLNQIPMSIVERIEVLPLGSSAVYGGDALAGVVNIVLKDRLDGASFEVRQGYADGTDDTSAAFAGGHTFSRGSFLAMAQWSRTSELLTTERDFFSNADYRSLGGTDTRTRSCSPGTVTSVSGNLNGVGSSFAAIPTSAAGSSPTLAEFAANAGVANLCGTYGTAGGATLIPQSETWGVHGAGTFDITDSLTAFTELTYNHADVTAPGLAVALSNVLVPASNAFNPFGTDVRVTTRLSPENLRGGNVRDSDFGRAVLGIKGNLAGSWDFEVAAVASGDQNRAIDHFNTVNTTARTAALASSDPATALNPFTTGVAASDAVLRSIWTDSRASTRGNRQMYTAVVRGPLFDLPAGALQVAAGAEYLDEDLMFRTLTSFLDKSRSSRAAFGEARLPVWSGTNSAGVAFDRLALSAAARIDDYSDVGKADTHQAGLEFRPREDLLMRAALATSFRPPGLLQQGLGVTTISIDLFGMTDPARGGEAVTGGLIRTGPNPNLAPEDGEGTVFGIEWSPKNIEGLRLSVNAWELDIKNYILRMDPQSVVNNESLFPGFVTREPSSDGLPGRITSVLYSYVNFGRLNVSGLDWRAMYSRSTPIGEASFGLNASQTIDYDVTIAPGSASEDRLGHRNIDAWAPEWKGNVSLGLSNPGWTIGFNGRYLGHYRDASTPRALGNIWTLDATGSISLRSLAGLVGASDGRLMLSVVNITDKLPQFVNVAPYFDLTEGSWRGRYVSARVSFDW